MDKKELKIQKALGTVKTYKCHQCQKEWAKSELLRWEGHNSDLSPEYHCPKCHIEIKAARRI